MSDLAPALPVEITTRNRLPGTRLSGRTTVMSASSESRPSLVTRRYTQVRKRRRKRVLTVLAVIIGLFPPMWIPYLVAWAIWRTRPKQKSMRNVRRSIRHLEKGESGVALKTLQQAHLLNPQNTDALYWLGLLLQQNGRPEEAVEALEIVSRRVPGISEVEAALVDAHLELDAPDAALFHAQRLYDAAPYETQSLLKLARALEAGGRVDVAIDSLQQAPLHKRTLTPELMDVHFTLAGLYERAGQPEDALRHYKRVYARDAGYRDVKECLARLESGD